jgi:tRNA dimethylallyltransferase
MRVQKDFQQGQLIPLVAIVGPTAVGKTEISVKLCQRLGGEVISADSVQVYRYLDIGSAKPTMEERRGIPHNLIDVVEPDVNFTVYDYQKLAQKSIREVFNKGNLPVLTGGTGLYIKAVLDGYNFQSGKLNPLIRKRLEEEAEARGKDYLYQVLIKTDPVAGQKIHPNDLRRIIRALEFFYLTGEPISLQQELTKKGGSKYNLTMIGITMQRNYLYERINERIDLMIKKGLLEEVKGLLERGYKSNLKSLQSLGYSHIIKYLQKKWE